MKSSSFARMSNLYAPTLKETPAEAELASHKLMLRAGLIRKSASGLYSYLPLAWRSIRKIEQIIREEMDRIGSQEMQVPILTDSEFWRQSGRWGAYGKELMRVTDRHDREFALGPTHEEAFTDLVRGELRSYKQLPVTLYQMQDKFRDELRPRFGLMRSREFIMKDGYSFAADEEQSRACYEDERGAYQRYCDRVGLKALQVAADTGEIGGNMSVEFMALADAGEAELVYCDSCGYAADVEAATTKFDVEEGVPGDLECCETPNCGTIDAVAAFFDVHTGATRKALALVDGDGNPVVVFVPGKRELQDDKAAHAFGKFHMMSDEEIEQFGLVKGFMGPVGLPDGVRVCADISLRDSQWWLVGANKKNYHYRHAQYGRDFEIAEDNWVDVVRAVPGDLCPECGKPLQGARGIEVGQVFSFGDKYSSSMGATFLGEDGQEHPFMMGSYGIGVSRTLAASVEQHHDESGIIWPVSIAPYEVTVIPLTVGDDTIQPAAEKIASDLALEGIDVIIDDRKERPGVKFADNDLMGFPYQVVVGKKSLADGNVEVKNRATGERENVPVDQVAQVLAQRVESERK